jgi:RNA polymerase sigma factor (sigma-70 family)
MNENETLAAQFEAHRPHLRAVAYRMLGSLSEAEDAVQEAWLHLSRAGADGVDNLGGWLTTIVARLCLDALRSRKARREEPLAAPATGAGDRRETGTDPEQEVRMADAVGLALLVVLEALGPAERIAFVLHDLFALPFEEIAPIVGRSPDAARQLASRARRRVQGAPTVPEAELARQREVVAAFLAALRNGDPDALVAVLDPDLVVHADSPPRAPPGTRGARAWARGAVAFAAHARFMRPALVNGAAGVVLAPGGRLRRALAFTFANGKIAGIDVIAEPGRLAAIEVALLDG